MDVVELTKKLVSIKSESEKDGELEVAKFAKQYLEDAEIRSELIEFGGNRADLVVSLGEGEGLMLNGHLDTVPVGEASLWTMEPHGTIEGNRIYGRGTSDMKGGVAAILNAIIAMASAPRKRRLLVTLVAGEETDFCGSRYLLENRKELFRRVRNGIIAEASDLKLQTSQKGIAPILLNFSGRGAHGSKPWLGESAVLKATAFIEEYRKLSKSKGLNDQTSNNGTYNIGRINGGTAINVVPDSCRIELDRRLAYGETPEGALAEVYDALKSANVSADVAMQDTAMPYKLNGESMILELMRRFVKGDEMMGFGYTEAELYKRLAGIDSVVFGPGTKDAIHKPDEYVEISNLKRAEEVFTSVAESWLSGK